MRNKSSCWCIVKNSKIFWSYVNKYFAFSHGQETVESWLVYGNKFSWIVQSSFLIEKTKSG